MAQLLQVRLQRYDAQPWGFRLQGGTDFAAPLVVQKINGGSLAEQAGLLPGDAVIKINEVDVFNLRHKDAQDLIVRSGNNFVVTIQRGGQTWRPNVTPTGQVPSPNPHTHQLQTVTKTSLAHKPQEVHHIGSGYNNSARPFNSINGGDGQVKSIVNKQYNTPVGIYSDETIAETLSAQAEVLAGGVLGINFKKNEKQYQAEKSEVLKFLHEEESSDPQEPEPRSPANFYWTHSHAIGGQRTSRPETPISKPQDERIGTPLQQNTLAPGALHRPSLPSQHPERIAALQSPEYKAELEAAAAAASVAPSERPPSTTTLPQCAICGVGIVGVFVRIKDKNLHVECFKCATCGTSLKNQGYYNFNNKLYCDIHARLAAMQHPPKGTEGYTPVPIKPSANLSATTISAALNNIGYNGTATNGSTTPSYSAPPSNGVGSAASGQASGNVTGANGMADDSINSNLTDSHAGGQGNDHFEYVTMHGNVIRSVIPPGKGVSVNYKVNQGFARPYGGPTPVPVPAAGPKSPTSYPPPTQGGNWGQPRPVAQQQHPPQQHQHQPVTNPYATLPRSNAAPQGRPYSIYATQYRKPTGPQNNFYRGPAGFKPPQAQAPPPAAYSQQQQQQSQQQYLGATNISSSITNISDSTSASNSASVGAGPSSVGGAKGGTFGATSAPKRGRGIINKAVGPGVRVPLCSSCNMQIRGPFITALGRIWCPDHFMCVNANCRRPLQDIGFVEEKGDLYCEFCFEKYLAPTCSKCGGKIKGDCLNAIGKHFHPECFTCAHCGKLFGNTPFFLEEGLAYCEADWNELFTTKCFACGFPVEAGDRWVEALNHNYHSQCFNCTFCKKNLEGQSFYNKGGRPFCKNHAR